MKDNLYNTNTIYNKGHIQELKDLKELKDECDAGDHHQYRGGIGNTWGCSKKRTSVVDRIDSNCNPMKTWEVIRVKPQKTRGNPCKGQVENLWPSSKLVIPQHNSKKSSHMWHESISLNTEMSFSQDVYNWNLTHIWNSW